MCIKCVTYGNLDNICSCWLFFLYIVFIHFLVCCQLTWWIKLTIFMTFCSFCKCTFCIMSVLFGTLLFVPVSHQMNIVIDWLTDWLVDWCFCISYRIYCNDACEQWRVHPCCLQLISRSPRAFIFIFISPSGSKSNIRRKRKT